MSSSPSQNSPGPDGLLRILASVFSGVLFGLFLSKLKTPSQLSVNSIAPKAQTKDENSSGDKLPTPGPQVPPFPERSDKTCQCRPHKTPVGKIVLGWLTFVVTAGACVAAIVYARITYRMWGEMQQQTCVQRNTAINAERAWVGLDMPVTLDLVAESNPGRVIIKGHYNLKNFGHGPAVKVMHTANFLAPGEGLEVQGREAQFFCDAAVKFATGTVPVGGTMKQSPPFGYTLFPNQPHDELIEYEGDAETLKFLQFIGCVAYIDQFKTVHWTRFCMQRRRGDTAKAPKLDFCSLYNDTDEPQEKPCQEADK